MTNINDTKDMFMNTCYPGRNISIPFCGECNEGLSETVGNGTACSDSCAVFSDIDLWLYIVGIIACFCFVLAILWATPDNPQVIEVLIFKVLLNFYQLSSFVISRSSPMVVMIFTDFFTMKTNTLWTWTSNKVGG